jgi:hypothetical protein
MEAVTTAAATTAAEQFLRAAQCHHQVMAVAAVSALAAVQDHPPQWAAALAVAVVDLHQM